MARATIDDLRAADRVLCYGVTGSGKSTLAIRLGALLDLEVVLVDELGWLPGWRSRDADDVRRTITEVVARDRWVLDSAWGAYQDLVLARSEVVVGLDLPRAVSLLRLLRRTGSRVIRREVVLNGNVETLRRALSRDSIVLWHWRSWRSKRDRLRGWEADPTGVPVLRLGRARDVERLISVLRAARPAG